MKSLLMAISLVAAALGQAPAQPVFGCNRMALDPQARTRHFDVLGPALRAALLHNREVPDGFEFEFPSDHATVQLLAEWAKGESLCCPFFDIAIRFDHDGGGMWLRLTGREGVKQFTRSDFASWFKQ
jgi:hypothetical protein